MRRKVWLAITLVMILAAMLFTASCAKKVVKTQPEPAAEPEIQAEPEVQAEPDTSPEEVEQDEQLMDELRAEAAAREAAEKAFLSENIHFPFDSSVLSDQAQQILNGKADYLRTNPDIAVIIEGHCDARGTDEYNIALGERRAESVKMFLVNLGIGINRLETVSYGEGRPIAMGDNEASWAENRRAHFVID